MRKAAGHWVDGATVGGDDICMLQIHRAMPLSAKRRATTFLRELACQGVVTIAARAASTGAQDSARVTFYEEREADSRFAADWDAALEQANAALEIEMHRRCSARIGVFGSHNTT
jgi:hypothetical protein